MGNCSPIKFANVFIFAGFAMFYVELIALCLLLFVLYGTSISLKYYVKFGIYYGGTIFFSFLLFPFLLLRPTNVLNLLTASKFCRHISRLINVTWTLRGAENLSKDQMCVIVANHQSSLDVLGMFEIWPVMNKTTVVAKRELLYVGPFGICAWLCGLVFIDRYAVEKAKVAMNSAIEKLKKSNTKLWVFPEGTRHNTGVIHEFKKGAFHAAIHGQVPILPVVFSSYRSFLDEKLKILNRGEVIIEALPLIPTEGLTHKDVNGLIEQTRKLMVDKFTEITKEVQLKEPHNLMSQFDESGPAESLSAH